MQSSSLFLGRAQARLVLAIAFFCVAVAGCDSADGAPVSSLEIGAFDASLTEARKTVTALRDTTVFSGQPDAPWGGTADKTNVALTVGRTETTGTTWSRRPGGTWETLIQFDGGEVGAVTGAGEEIRKAELVLTKQGSSGTDPVSSLYVYVIGQEWHEYDATYNCTDATGAVYFGYWGRSTCSAGKLWKDVCWGQTDGPRSCIEWGMGFRPNASAWASKGELRFDVTSAVKHSQFPRYSFLLVSNSNKVGTIRFHSKETCTTDSCKPKLDITYGPKRTKEICDSAELGGSADPDEDQDGLTDCDDPDCVSHHHCIAEVCGNGADDDGDGYVDCLDSECLDSDSRCEVMETRCTDGFDNDSDGAADCEDEYCAARAPCTPDICDNGIDDNHDGAADCDDVTCKTFHGCIEEVCGNEVDDDGDGQVDCADGECAAESACIPEQCTNGVDDDRDGLTDCRDEECAAQEECRVTVPNDPVPPAFDPTENPAFADRIAFLYTGDHPVQEGVRAETIEPMRAAVLSGYVYRRDTECVPSQSVDGCLSAEPVAGARVTVLGHPEYGATYTRADGRYDLAVNGGGALTIDVQKVPYLRVQRTVQVPFERYLFADDIALTLPRGLSGVLDLDANQRMQVVHTGEAEDEDGPRAVTMFIPAGITAEAEFNGELEHRVQRLSGRVTVRATEYTVGDRGTAAMPGYMPEQIAYTYAAEFDIDEARDAGADNVHFNAPIAVYTENFLGFPVGMTMPVGYYDRQQGRWEAERDGVTVRLLGADAEGRAVLSLSEDGSPASDERLAEYGITDEERYYAALHLCDLEPVEVVGDDGVTRICLKSGTLVPRPTYWRTSTQHFSPFDFNLGWLPENAEAPANPEPERSDEAEPCEESGSIVQCESSAVAERVPVLGSPHVLRYQSNRVPGRTERSKLRIPIKPLIGRVLPEAIHVTTMIAGQRERQVFIGPAAWGQSHAEFEWNGHDAWGRALDVAPAHVTLCYQYRSSFVAPPVISASQFSFGSVRGNVVETPPQRSSRGTMNWCARWTGYVGSPDARRNGLLGLTLESVHRGETGSQGAWMPSDGRPPEQSLGLRATTVFNAKAGGPIQAANIGRIAVDPKGRLTVAVRSGAGAAQVTQGIYRFEHDGTVTRIVGSGVSSRVAPDGPVPGHQFPLGDVMGLAYGPAGELYFSVSDLYAVFVLRDDGLVYRFAGDGNLDDGRGPGTAGDHLGDGGMAVDAHFDLPTDITVAPDGTVYIIDFRHVRVRRVDPSGRIETVLSDAPSVCGLQDPVTGEFNSRACDPGEKPFPIVVSTLEGLAWRDGVVFVGVPAGVLALRSGQIDLALATRSEDRSTAIATTLDGRLVLRSYKGVSIARVGMTDSGTGMLLSVDEFLSQNHADGPRSEELAGDFTELMTLSYYNGWLSVGPSGDIFVGSNLTGGGRIYRVSESLVAQDGGVQHDFNELGQHVSTSDPLTGQTLLSMTYDEHGLRAIQGGQGAEGRMAMADLRIERPRAGIVELIHEFGGHRRVTVLEDTTGDGFANEIRYGEATDAPTYRAEYFAGGLLKAFSTPQGVTSRFTYNDDGLLRTDQLGGQPLKALDKSEHRRGVREGDVVDTDARPSGFEAVDGVRQRTWLTEYDVNVTTSAGDDELVTNYLTRRLGTGAREREVSAPNGTVTRTSSNLDGQTTSWSPDGTISQITTAADPAVRGGRFVKSSVVWLPEYEGELREARMTQDRVMTESRGTTTVSTSRTAAGRTIHTQEVIHPDGTQAAKVVIPSGLSFTSVRDDQGRVVQTQAPGLYPVRRVYDETGRLTHVIQGPEGDVGESSRVTEYRYDHDGDGREFFVPEAIRTADGDVVFGRDELGQLKQVTAADASTVTFDHDLDGRLASLTPPGRERHGFAYGEDGTSRFLTSYQPPSLAGNEAASEPTSYSVDQTGRSHGSVMGGNGGVSIEYFRDEHEGRFRGQLKTIKALRDGATEQVVSLSYDEQTRALKSVTTGDGNGVHYEQSGPLLEKSRVTGLTELTLDYGYNQHLEIDRVDIGQGTDGQTRLRSLALAYGADGELSQVGALALDQDLARRSLTVTLGNAVTSRSWTPFGELAEESTSVLEQDFTFEVLSRDGQGRITRKRDRTSEGERIFGYVYDVRGRLTAVHALETEIQAIDTGVLLERFAYDDNGVRVEASGYGEELAAENIVVDAQDRLLEYGALEFAYNGQGQLQSRLDRNTGRATQYRYDVLGNLRAVALPGGDVIEYGIDALNRRISRSVNGQIQRRWVYKDALNPVAELNAAGELEKIFLYGSKAHVPDAMIVLGASEAEDKHYRIVSDHLGSVRAVVDAGTGAVGYTAEYSSFGRIVAQTGDVHLQPFGFAGGLTDADTGLVRFGARDYDPETGRWTAKDPIGFEGGDTNLYGYVGGDPVNHVDPNGLWVIQAIGAGLGAGFNMYDAWQAGGSAGDIALAGLVGAATGALATFGVGAVNLGLGALAAGANQAAMNGLSGQCDLMVGVGKAALLGGLANSIGAAFSVFKRSEPLNSLARRSRYIDVSLDLTVGQEAAHAQLRHFLVELDIQAAQRFNVGLEAFGTFTGGTATGVGDRVW